MEEKKRRFNCFEGSENDIDLPLIYLSLLDFRYVYMYVLDVLAISMWIHQPAVRHSDKVHSRNRLITGSSGCSQVQMTGPDTLPASHP